MTELERQLAVFEPVAKLIDPGRRLAKAEKCGQDAPSLWVYHVRNFWQNIPESTALAIRVAQAKGWIDRWLLRDVSEIWTLEIHWCRASASSSDKDNPKLRHIAMIVRTSDCRDGPDIQEELEGRSLPELYVLIVAWMHEHSEHEKNLRAIRRNALAAQQKENPMPEPTIAEMTAFVAVHGMGYHEPVEVCDYTVWIDSDEIEHFFDPATVPADRDALVEAMVGRPCVVQIRWYTDKICRCVIYYAAEIIASVEADTPGVAVLTAAFKALKALKENE